MDITQVAHNKDNVFGRSPQIKSDPADDFDRYIDTDTSDASDYDVKETREADRYHDDYRDDVDDGSDAERSENDTDTDTDTAMNPSNDQGVTEPASTSVTDNLETASSQETQGTAKTSRTETDASAQSGANGTAVTAEDGEATVAPVTSNSTDTTKTANANAGTPAEAAQNAVLNGPASDVAKGRMAGTETSAAATTDQVAKKQKATVTDAAATPTAADKKVEGVAQQTTAAQQVAAAQQNKSAKPQSEQTGNAEKVANGQQNSTPTALEKMRADEIGRMSEKEILTQKLSELLNAAKGKITGVQSQSKGTTNGNTSTGGMASSQNLIQASTTPTSGQMVPPPTSTAVGTIAQNVAQADTPIIVPNADVTAPVVSQTQPTGADLSQNGTLATTTSAVTGIDSTSSSSASQANQAARANAQTGSPAEQVSTQLINAAKDGNEKIKVQLHPAELGRVDIKLEVSQDGRVMAVIAADNQESLDLLQQDSKALEQALKDAGFETDQGSLNFSLNQDPDGKSQTASSEGDASSAEAAEEITLETQLAALSAQNATSSGLNIQV